MAERGQRRGRRPSRRLLIVLGVAVLALGGGIGAFAATRSTSDTYRLATAGPATVTATLAATGTIEPVSEATVSFPMSGQVTSVGVRQGQQVGSGQTLAQLNTTTLATQVSSAQSTVAKAEATLANDQASQSAVTTAITTHTDTGGGTSGAPSGTSASEQKLAALAENLASGQVEVTNAQKQVDADLTLVSADVAADQSANQACPQVIAYLRTLGTNQPTTSPSTSDQEPSTTDPAPSPNTIDSCQSLMRQVLTDESKASADEHTLAGAETTLSTALNYASAAAAQATTGGVATGGHGSSTTSPQSASGTSGGNSRNGASGGGSASGGPASADQIAADQAAADAANAQLAQAQQNMAAATLLSPIAGTVARVHLTQGQNVSANSATDDIVIVGSGVDEVTTAVSDSEVGQIRPGQAADVTPDGAATPIAGHVSSIGALATTASNGTASYPVTISLNPLTRPLFAGSTASVAITLNTAHAAVAVPTSAVQRIGSIAFVKTLAAGTLTPTRVQLGVQGAELTQIVSGLKAGTPVVLADVSTALPTSGTGTRGFGGGTVRFSGGGFGGGGRAGASGSGAGKGGSGGGR